MSDETTTSAGSATVTATHDGAWNGHRVFPELMLDGTIVHVAIDLTRDGCMVQAKTREAAIAALNVAREEWDAARKPALPPSDSEDPR